MMKTLLSTIVILGLVGAAWMLYRAREQAPVIAPNAVVTTLGAEGVECHETAGYYIVTRSRIDTSEVGTDILVKHKATSREAQACAYTPEEGDTELAEAGPTYFFGITEDYLVLDSGTAPHPRGIAVYDLKKEQEVYTDRYNTPAEVVEGVLTYWKPVDTVPNAENCPDLETYVSNGLGAGIESHVALEVSTLELQELGETRCAARQ